MKQTSDDSRKKSALDDIEVPLNFTNHVPSIEVGDFDSTDAQPDSALRRCGATVAPPVNPFGVTETSNGDSREPAFVATFSMAFDDVAVVSAAADATITEHSETSYSAHVSSHATADVVVPEPSQTLIVVEAIFSAPTTVEVTEEQKEIATALMLAEAKASASALAFLALKAEIDAESKKAAEIAAEAVAKSEKDLKAGAAAVAKVAKDKADALADAAEKEKKIKDDEIKKMKEIRRLAGLTDTAASLKKNVVEKEPVVITATTVEEAIAPIAPQTKEQEEEAAAESAKQARLAIKAIMSEQHQEARRATGR